MALGVRERVTFRARLVHAGPDNSWLALRVPRWVADEIGAETSRVPVLAAIEGFPQRTWLRRSLDGDYVMYVNAIVRHRARLEAGSEVTVEIGPDSEPRGTGMPEELRQVLEDDPDAAGEFRGRGYDERRDLVRYVQEARTSRGRTFRAAQVQKRLRAGR